MSLMASAFISKGASLMLPTAIVMALTTTAKGLRIASLECVSETILNICKLDASDLLFLAADPLSAHERNCELDRLQLKHFEVEFLTFSGSFRLNNFLRLCDQNAVGQYEG